MEKIEIIEATTENVGLVRTSTRAQQDDGDSPEIQKAKIEHAVSKGNQSIGIWINIAQPASGEFDSQPLLKSLPIIKQYPTIKRVWVSIVNRATRAPLVDFLLVKTEFAKNGLELCDTQGELTSDVRDTLEDFGVDYKFNKYDANEGKMVDSIRSARRNWRDILTQLHSAEISAARKGYWVSGNFPMGYMKVKRQTVHGRRIFLEKDTHEQVWMDTMFKMALEKVDLNVILDTMNGLGYLSRHQYKREHGIEVGEGGRKKLILKQLRRFLSDPIYCLIRDSKSQQTQGKPIQIHGTPYITIDQFNKINEGKVRILIDETGEIKILRTQALERYLKNRKTEEFPFKKYILCPLCGSTLYGSAPRNKQGKYIPRYHCSRNSLKQHKYWSVNKVTFDETILNFTKSLKITDEKLAEFREKLVGKAEQKLVTLQGVAINHQSRVLSLEMESKELMMKIKATKNLTIMAELEKDYEKVEAEKLAAMIDRDNAEKNQIDLKMVIDRVMYFLKHLDKGLLNIKDPVKRAACWSTIFVEAPRFDELNSSNTKLRSHIEIIRQSNTADDVAVGTKRFELLTLSV